MNYKSLLLAFIFLVSFSVTPTFSQSSMTCGVFFQSIDNGNSISVIIDDFYPPFTIGWDGPVSSHKRIEGDAYTIPNLPAGDYTIIVTNSLGCYTRTAGRNHNSDNHNLIDNDVQTPTDCTTSASTVSTTSNTTSVFVCSGDGISDIVNLSYTANTPTQYVLVMVDNEGKVVGILANAIELEGSPAERCRIYGISYTGNLLLSSGDDFATSMISDGCSEVSSNYITVIIQAASTCAQGEDQRVLTSNDIAIYPNPVQHSLHVNLNRFWGQEGRLMLFSTTGSVVEELSIQEITSDQIEMQINHLQSGLYLLKVMIEEDLIYTHKIFKK